VTRPADLADLARLARLAHAAAEQRMGVLRRREDELRGTLAELDAARRDRAAATAGQIDPALQAGQDLRWHRWIDGRRQTLNAELARVLAGQAQVRAELARDFGRKEAIESLRRDALAAQQKARERRAF
jgi:hypothetical protein